MKKAFHRSFIVCLQIALVVLMLLPQSVFATPASAPPVIHNQGDAALSEALTLISTNQWQAALAKLAVAQKFYSVVGNPRSESIVWRYIGLAKFSIWG